MFYYVYVLQSLPTGELYVGFTRNLRHRLSKHNRMQNRSTKAYAPWKLYTNEAYRNDDDARRRERYLKANQGARLLKRMLREYF